MSGPATMTRIARAVSSVAALYGMTALLSVV